jgi:protein phosphatase
MVVIESAGLTDVGKKRKGNEDALIVDDELGLYIVADGMGGHRAGEVASQLVIESMRDYLKRFQEDAEAQELEDIDASLSKEANRILAGIHLSNTVVFQTSSNDEAYLGMGSTVSVISVNDRTLVAANVGDSPIYLIHKGKIELLSEPHTVVAEHAAIDPEGAQQLGGEFRHMLTRAIGTEETVKASVCEIPYFKDDILVICSDGLSDLVETDEILEVVRTHPPERACRTLIDLANQRGGTDNITVVVLKVKKTGSNNGKMKNLILKVTEGFSNMTSRKK